MKIIRLLVLVSLAVLISCSHSKTQIPASVVNIPNSAEGSNDQSMLPAMKFAQVEHDFGKIIQGEKVTYAFKFKNTGNSDLVIAKVSTTCGCTASDYPKDPVRPGEEGIIEASFDSSGKQGFQSKDLTIAANTQPANTILTIKAIVIIPENQ
jgi:major membrane immunogen (membrane-anchored lipoprotein)